MIIDSHAHYNNNAYKKPFRYLSYDKAGYALKEGEREQLFQELLDANIPYSIEPGVSLQSCEEVLQLCAEYPDRIFPAMGIHPTRSIYEKWTDRKKLDRFAEIIGKELDREGYSFYNADVLIIPSNVREGFWSKEDNACALENIFLAAHSLGIGSVWVNQLQLISDRPAVRELLSEWGIPKDHVVYGMAALGYAAEEPSQEVSKKGVIRIID